MAIDIYAPTVEDKTDLEEKQLYDLIMGYRSQHG